MLTFMYLEDPHACRCDSILFGDVAANSDEFVNPAKENS